MRFRCLLFALTVAGAAAAAPTSAEGITVETGSPDALCPDLATTRQAIYARVGAFESAQKLVVRYTVGHSAVQGSFIRLEILDGTGERRILRDLPRDGESCATLAQAIAVVVERYLQGPEPLPQAEEPALAPKAAEPSPVPAAPKPEAKPTPAPVPAPSPAPRLTPDLSFGIAAGYLSAPPNFLVGVGAGYWVLPWFRPQLELQAGLTKLTDNLAEGSRDASSADEVGEAHLRVYPLRVTLGFGQQTARWDWFVGPSLRATYKSADQDGLTTTSHDSGGVDGDWALGLGAGIQWWHWDQLALTLNVAADAKFAGTEFNVKVSDSQEKTVLELPVVQFAATLGVSLGARP